jgi:hypothetical protein
VLRGRVRAGLIGAVVLVGLSACSGSSGGGSAGGATQTTIPAPLQAFIARVAKAGSIPFTAKYEVLQKLGGTTTEVTVDAAPPAWRITAGDVVVIGGPVEATCHVAAATCKKGIDETALSSTGIFSGFFADSTAQQLRATANRAGATAPTFSQLPVAGVKLDCTILASGPITACITPEGVFGLVDDSSRRASLTSWSTAKPTTPITPPAPVS